MRVRQLERVLVECGVPASFLDVVTRKLREARLLPVGGRGNNAPEIGASEAALVLAGMAGADVAAQADWAIHKQLELRLLPGAAFRYAPEFVDALQLIVGDSAACETVREVRFGRTHALSEIIYRDGHVERFVGPEAPQLAEEGVARFRTEGVIGGDLLRRVAGELAGGDIPALADPAMGLAEKVPA